MLLIQSAKQIKLQPQKQKQIREIKKMQVN
jgi:hypothetical protein